jgi:hypothetical protein
MEIAETRREKKDRLHLTFRRLMSLKLRVDDCLSKSKPLSETDYNALVAISQSRDHVIQIAVLDEATRTDRRPSCSTCGPNWPATATTTSTSI